MNEALKTLQEQIAQSDNDAVMASIEQWCARNAGPLGVATVLMVAKNDLSDLLDSLPIEEQEKIASTMTDVVLIAITLWEGTKNHG